MKVSISEAFTIRKKVTEFLKNLNTLIKYAGPYKVDETGKQLSIYKDLSYNEVEELYNKTADILSDLNVIIDKANVDSGAKSLLHKIAATKEKTSLATHLRNTAEMAFPVKSVFDQTTFNKDTNAYGVWQKLELEPALEQKEVYEQKIEKYKVLVLSLEAKLSNLNYSYMVEIPKNVSKFVVDNNIYVDVGA